MIEVKIPLAALGIDGASAAESKNWMGITTR